jgi:toxin-antitoxin system PIN domain toxin
VTILDANLLLYAYNADAPQHDAAMRWLKKLLGEKDGIIALPWITIWAFIRICTNPRIWNSPLSAKEALAIMNEWLTQPGIIVLQPGPRHWDILKALVLEHNATSALMTDAVLAALAIENGAFLASADQDFSRFRDLRWINPFHD